MTPEEEFTHANRAFDVFTLQERKLALEAFGRLQYPSVIDRFTEAVYQVIVRNDRPDPAGTPLTKTDDDDHARVDREQLVDRPRTAPTERR